MARVVFYTRSGKKEDQPIRIRFSRTIQDENGKPKTVIIYGKTQETVNKNYWSNKTGKPVNSIYFDGYKVLSDKLEAIKKIIEEDYKTADKSEINSDWLNTCIDKYYRPDKYLSNDTLFGYIQNFINNSTKRLNSDNEPVCYKVRREYEVTFNYLKEYCKEKNKGKEVDFIDMDKEFKENFTDFLRKNKELHNNTIVRKLTTLKTFLNDAKAEGKNPFDKYRGWKTKKTETDHVYLTSDELKQLYSFDFSNNKRLEKVRDMFIVGSFTGLRFGDLTHVTPENIVNDLIHVKQSKTGGRVVIPLHPVVKEILNKYNGSLPEPISNQKYNEYLKEACEIAEINEVAPFKTDVKDEATGKTISKHLPKYKLVGSHTARRSFATNAYLSGMETLHIRAITGHKTEKAFLKYIKVTPEQHAEKIREFWAKQGEFMKAL